jgi:hypothetical protein
MTYQELSAKYGVCRSSIYNLVSHLKLPRVKRVNTRWTELDGLILCGKTNADIREAIPGIGKSKIGHRRKMLGMLTRPSYTKKPEHHSEPRDVPVITDPNILRIRCEKATANRLGMSMEQFRAVWLPGKVFSLDRGFVDAKR